MNPPATSRHRGSLQERLTRRFVLLAYWLLAMAIIWTGIGMMLCAGIAIVTRWYEWLQVGRSTPAAPLGEFLSGLKPHTEWVGLQSIIDSICDPILAFPLTWFVLILGVPIFLCGLLMNQRLQGLDQNAGRKTPEKAET